MRTEKIDLQPFFIEFEYDNKNVIAEIKPCCQSDDVFYYDVQINNKYQFTVTPSGSELGFGWRVALVNADKKVDPLLADIIGQHIEKHLMQ